MAGSEFRTKTGKAFKYDISGAYVALRNTNRNLPRTHFERALQRAPISGPGQLQDLQGPSYIYAILADPRVGDTLERDAVRSRTSQQPSTKPRELKVEKSASEPGHRRVGTTVSEAELREQDFTPRELAFRTGEVPLPLGIGSDWDTLGAVPNGPGLYAFTTEESGATGSLRVTYVGLTTHLWMVTKGQLPGGLGRGGQRYGRPKHTGETRKRVNIEITRARAQGLHVKHWLRPMPNVLGREAGVILRDEEERLIRHWDLRRSGWNRG